MANEIVPEVIKEFSCSKVLPSGRVCGSTRRMMEELAKEMRAEGKLDEDTVDVGINEIGGPMVSRDAMMKLLAPTIIPGNYALTDVCIDCGHIYVFKIMRKPVLAGTAAMNLPTQGGMQHT